MLLDCGVSPKRLIQSGVDMTKVEACLLTHRHRDHSKYAPSLVKRSIDVFTTLDTIESLGLKKHHRMHAVSCYQMDIGSWEFIPTPVPHDVPCLGFFVRSKIDGETLLYLTDCAYFPAVVPAPIVIALEVNHDIGSLKKSNVNTSRKVRTRLNHMGLTEALRVIRQHSTPKLREIHVLHMSESNADEREIKRKIEAVAGVPVYIAEE